jgi:hypothetical protein
VKKSRYIFLFTFIVVIFSFLYYLLLPSPLASEESINKPSTENIVSNDRENDKLPNLSNLLSKRCGLEGILFENIQTLSALPEIPAASHNEAAEPWPKFIGKLEARYGMVPVYDEEDPEFSNPPRSVKIIGRFLYFGKNPREVEALKLLADGDAALRSQALDTFEDGDSHAVPLFLALQARDEDAQIRMQATQRLQFFDSARVVDASIAALGDSDEAVQAAARSTLVLIGGDRVLKSVRMAVNSPNPRISEMALSILQDNLER